MQRGRKEKSSLFAVVVRTREERKMDIERRMLPVEKTKMEQQGGDKQQGEEVLRCKTAIKKRSYYKIKEAT
jgi:hypothetical protein